MPSAMNIFNGVHGTIDLFTHQYEKVKFMVRTGLNIENPYCDDLKGILQFSDFTETEKTIERLEKLCRKYRKASDKKGMEYCRKIALLGRQRAELISKNKRVGLKKRLQKHEIAEWFRIWMETPAIFGDWLEMRKQTEDFKKLL